MAQTICKNSKNLLEEMFGESFLLSEDFSTVQDAGYLTSEVVKTTSECF